jgi:hypothetical protein
VVPSSAGDWVCSVERRGLGCSVERRGLGLFRPAPGIGFVPSSAGDWVCSVERRGLGLFRRAPGIGFVPSSAGDWVCSVQRRGLGLFRPAPGIGFVPSSAGDWVCSVQRRGLGLFRRAPGIGFVPSSAGDWVCFVERRGLGLFRRAPGTNPRICHFLGSLRRSEGLSSGAFGHRVFGCPNFDAPRAPRGNENGQSGLGVFRISKINERVRPTPVARAGPIHEAKIAGDGGQEVPHHSTGIIDYRVYANRVKSFVFR